MARASSKDIRLQGRGPKQLANSRPLMALNCSKLDLAWDIVDSGCLERAPQASRGSCPRVTPPPSGSQSALSTSAALPNGAVAFFSPHFEHPCPVVSTIALRPLQSSTTKAPAQLYLAFEAVESRQCCTRAFKRSSESRWMLSPGGNKIKSAGSDC
jgi:hypothetical protein